MIVILFDFQCRIMRDADRVNSEGTAKSRGYGFVNFSDHNHALQALRSTNNNPDLFGEKRVSLCIVNHYIN